MANDLMEKIFKTLFMILMFFSGFFWILAGIIALLMANEHGLSLIGIAGLCVGAMGILSGILILVVCSQGIISIIKGEI